MGGAPSCCAWQEWKHSHSEVVLCRSLPREASRVAESQDGTGWQGGYWKDKVQYNVADSSDLQSTRSDVLPSVLAMPSSFMHGDHPTRRRSVYRQMVHALQRVKARL